MIVESFPTGPLQANCTLLGDKETGEAVIVDPGAEVDRIHRRLGELGLTLKQILLTHAHLDHAGVAVKLKRLTGAPILLHHGDLSLLQSMGKQAAWLGMDAPEVEPPDGFLLDAQIVGLTNYPAQVICTPGHTQGSISLYIAEQKLLIAGDTLFAGSIGRTDLPGGDYSQIMHSIRYRLLTLPHETRVICGHGPATTIGKEWRDNPFLRADMETV
jgi:glyoxylase-like metal-dependent hydrolase (beta-lactamase superfamily II)